MTRALGIDVGGTTTKVCLTDESGELLATTNVPSPRNLNVLADTVAEHVAWGRQYEPDLEAVGVVVPGIVDEVNGIAVHSVNLGWRDVPMRELFSAAAGTPVTLGQDVRAGALAESRWGAGAPDMLYVPIGTGIGAALILDGRPVMAGVFSGEIGQALVTDPVSGDAVTMETVASASAIARRYAERQDVGDVTAGGTRHIVERAATGDAAAQQVLDEAVAALAEVLATSVTLLGPVRVVLGGGLARAGEVLASAVRDGIAARLVVTPRPEVVTASLGLWSQALGAAAQALDERDDRRAVR